MVSLCSGSSNNVTITPIPTILLVAILAVTVGCGQSATDMLAELDRVREEEHVAEIALGYYVVPVPMPYTGEHRELATRNRMQFEFDLYAEVPSKYRSRAKAAVKRNEGRLRDTVIFACRSTPMEDLNDQSLTALKSHLADSTIPLLDGVPIGQLRIVDRQTKPL
jgi:hypothetical protein